MKTVGPGNARSRASAKNRRDDAVHAVVAAAPCAIICEAMVSKVPSCREDSSHNDNEKKNRQMRARGVVEELSDWKGIACLHNRVDRLEREQESKQVYAKSKHDT
jgi:hypothetical protein